MGSPPHRQLHRAGSKVAGNSLAVNAAAPSTARVSVPFREGATKNTPPAIGFDVTELVHALDVPNEMIIDHLLTSSLPRRPAPSS